LPKDLDIPQQWLNPETSVEIIGARAITLGPEPILPAQRLVLSIEGLSLSVVSDGLGPFLVDRPGEAPLGDRQ
jgi:general secretion pathway protein H